MKDSSLQKRASIILITGVIFMVSIGVLYAWSVISRVIIEEWSWTSLQAGVPFSLALVFFATGNLIGGRLQVKISARIVGTIGGAMVGGGFLLCGLFGNNPIAVAICFGVITGLGVGFGYSSFLPTLLKWYHPGRKGFVSGWIIGGFGLTSLYLAPLSSYLLYNFDIKLTFIILGIKTLVISLPLAQFIKSPPDGYTPPIPSNMKQKSIATLPVDKTWKEMMATNEFYLLFFMFLCSVSIGQMVIGNITGIAELQAGINNASLLAGLVAFMALVNAIGRIVGGIVSDKIGWANTLLFVFAIHLVNMIGFRFYSSLPLLILGVALAGLCFGSTLSVYPAITVDRFGLKNYSSNYGIMYMAFGFAGVAAPFIASYFRDIDGHYNTVFTVCAVGMLLMIGINLLVRKVIRK